MQPLDSSTSLGRNTDEDDDDDDSPTPETSPESSSIDRFTRAASMFRAAMSFTITATFMFFVFSRMWCSNVVLPAPRNPDSTVTGMGRPPLSCIDFSMVQVVQQSDQGKVSRS
jgi:hypothetical protein